MLSPFEIRKYTSGWLKWKYIFVITLENGDRCNIQFKDTKTLTKTLLHLLYQLIMVNYVVWKYRRRARK